MPLGTFNSACRNWFSGRFGQPTPAQAEAWPAIQQGRHTLIADMDSAQIFGNYVRPMGIGCIAVAGIIGILKSYNFV